MNANRKPISTVRMISIALVITCTGLVAISRFDWSPAEAQGGVRGGAVGDEVEWDRVTVGWPSSVALSGDELVIGHSNRLVTQVDARDGTAHWSTVVEGLTRGRAAMGAGLVVVPAIDRLVAIDARTGAITWEHYTQGEPGPALIIEGAGPMVAVGTSDGALIVLSASSGEVIGSASYPGSVYAAPVDLGGAIAAVWVGREDSQVHALDTQTGAQRWSAELDGISGAPLVFEDTVIVGARRSVIALDSRSGEKLWTQQTEAGFEVLLEFDTSAEEIAIVDHLGHVSLLNASTGARLWAVDLDTVVLRGGPVLTGDAVVLATERGDLVTLARSDGEVKGRITPDGFPIAIVGNTAGPNLFVALRVVDPGRVVAYRVR